MHSAGCCPAAGLDALDPGSLASMAATGSLITAEQEAELRAQLEAYKVRHTCGACRA